MNSTITFFDNRRILSTLLNHHSICLFQEVEAWRKGCHIPVKEHQMDGTIDDQRLPETSSTAESYSLPGIQPISSQSLSKHSLPSNFDDSHTREEPHTHFFYGVWYYIPILKFKHDHHAVIWFLLLQSLGSGDDAHPVI